MAYETGTVENERELIQKIDKFLTSNPKLVEQGQAWERLYTNTNPADSDMVERIQYAWKSSNTGSDQTIYIAAETLNNIAEDRYNLAFLGGTSFNPEFAVPSNLEFGMLNPSKKVTLFASNRTFTYHLIGDGRKLMVFTQIGEVTSSLYAGFILPLVTPQEYPYPLCIAGSGPLDNNGNISIMRHSLRNYLFSSFVSPRYQNCYLFTPDQTWRDFYSDNYYARGDGENQFLFPTMNQDASLNDNTLFMFRTIAAAGVSPLVPVEFVSLPGSSQGINRWGCFEDVYWTPGVGRQRGDVVELDGNRCGLVFNNAYNTTTTDYFVVVIGEKSELMEG